MFIDFPENFPPARLFCPARLIFLKNFPTCMSIPYTRVLFFCCLIKQTNKKYDFFSQIYHCEPPSSRKHSTVVRHSGTIVPFLAELSQTPNKIRAFFPTVTSHTHKYFDGYFWIYDALWWKYGKEQEVYVIYNFSHLKI